MNFLEALSEVGKTLHCRSSRRFQRGLACNSRYCSNSLMLGATFGCHRIIPSNGKRSPGPGFIGVPVPVVGSVSWLI
jgi:hypothetical protein